MKIQAESRVFVRWPISGVPAGSPVMQVRFDGGTWHDLEYMYGGGVVPLGTRLLVSGPLFIPNDMIESVLLDHLGVYQVEFRFADNPENIIQSAGSIEVVAIAPAEAITWGVTVPEVVSLLPHISVANEPELADDDMFAGSAKKVRVGDVARWITAVSAIVDARLQARTALTPAVREVVHNAAHTIVLNGAAEYVVSAAFPLKSGVNDQTNYSSELHRRYAEGLEALEALLDKWLAPGGSVDPTVPSGGSAVVSGSFPEARFPDAIRW